MVCAAVLSGNRNCEARIHPNIRANFLASPPLVVAYALAGSVLVDFMTQPLGKGSDGKDVYIGHIWPTQEEIAALMRLAMDPATFRRLYSNLGETNPLWKKIAASTGQVYGWPKSTYIDRKSTRLNSSHSQISYAVFCLKKKKNRKRALNVLTVAGDNALT